MFKDKEEELKRLSRLLQEEDDEAEEPESVEEPPEEEEPVIYHNYANRYGQARIYNNDTSDADLEAYSDEVYEPRKKVSLLVLTAIALALAAGIMGVLAWWAARYL